MENQFEIKRDGVIDKSYKPKVIKKHIVAAIKLTAAVTAIIASKTAEWSVGKLDELTKPVRLDLFDWKYGTNLRAQYFSGRRTQQILSAKRQYGLM